MSDALTQLMEAEETSVQYMPVNALAALNKSEVESQLDAAHKYARKTKVFLQEAKTLATLTKDIAESCMYSIPRGGKAITGPSVRLAEMMASAYGNLMVAARVIDATDTEVIAQGIAWDLEKNYRVVVETRRRITNKQGKRYDDDMVVVTGNAAASIALRNAIFRVVPRAYVNVIYEEAKRVAVGDATTLSARRDEVVARLGKMGATPERVFGAIDAKGIEDVSIEKLEVLIGLGTAIKQGDKSVDECFPPILQPVAAVADAPEGRRMSLKKKESKVEPLVTDAGTKHDADGVVVDDAKPAEREPGAD